VRGVRRGAEGLNPAAARQLGVAIYADWTTEPAEWETYKRLWLQAE
jgi:hypothetical protein